MDYKHTNALIKETSPYLLQHAHNPVNWEAWSTEIIERAQNENKLLLISIGYAACHWCHVMEKESFEDEEVAEVMNTHFINIKVDREERPDVDHVYMDALQMITGSGGWPLNIVALPDGRPFWGATYVPKGDWMRILAQLAELYTKDPDKIERYAEELVKGIKAVNLIEPTSDPEVFILPQLDEAVANWSRYFDKRLGGYQRAPKFMMPANLDFLLHYATAQNDEGIFDYVTNTLTKMAYGGVYDHLGGGFSRYSIDAKWHIPHFEKMLYDNAQLISVYSKAYSITGNVLYKQVVEETIRFVEKELSDDHGGFYSSLDADSTNDQGELEEGAYYVWQKDSLEQLLGDDFDIFSDYYNINNYGLWEHGNYVLIRDASAQEIADKHNISKDQLHTILERSKGHLLQERENRNKPRLDDKILTSWNGLMLTGLVDAYRYLGSEDYLERALKNARFIEAQMASGDGGLFHNHKNGRSTINGYLEDYASVIEGFLKLYEVTFDEHWLTSSKELLDYCVTNFFDDTSQLFYFTSTKDDYIIRRTLEVSDNVIPASNSIMAKNLYKLSKFFPDENYSTTAANMLKNIQENFDKNAQNYANWLHLVLYRQKPFYEVAIIGTDYKNKARAIQKRYLPNTLFAGANQPNELFLLKDRFVSGETLIYVCQEGSCKLPVSKIEVVMEQVQYTTNKQ